MSDHNHPTRGIKPFGECPACDGFYALEAEARLRAGNLTDTDFERQLGILVKMAERARFTDVAERYQRAGERAPIVHTDEPDHGLAILTLRTRALESLQGVDDPHDALVQITAQGALLFADLLEKEHRQ